MTLQAGRRQQGKSGDQGRARVTRGRKSRLERRYDLRLEALECRCLLAGDVVDGPLVLPPPRVPSAVEGIKWEDLNGNGQRDRGEPGLPGVIIYADLNRNGALDRNEPLTRTMRDNPHTREDETGRYWLGNLGAGEYVIREVVPDGFLQTFPPITPATPAGDDVPPDGQEDEIATITPSQLVLTLGAGERAVQTVTYTFHPVCIREFPVSVRAEGTMLEVENLTGPQTNGCGGDTSKFEIAITGDGQAHSFELQLFDPESGAVLGTIPVTVNPFEIPGAHHVELKPNQTVSGIDFGNQRQAGSSIHGLKWNDLNANGQQDEGELGVAGVRIYLDLNGNGQYDGRDLVTLTMRDDPTTEVDETGHYWFNGLRPGEYLVGEVLPRGYEQTFPGVASRIVDQQNGQLGAGVALDLDVTDIAVAPAADGALVGKLELTVVWPDSCGKLQSEDSVYTIIGDHIIVELSGRQEGDACAEVISPQQETLRLDGLQRGRYDIVASLHEELRDGSVLATLVTVATVELGGPGQHHVRLGENEHLEGINFGNRSIIQPGSVSGVKWNDLNGDGQRSDDERGLPGVVIYADLNRNGQLDRSEPRTTSREDDPATDVDETGQYELAGLPPRTYVIREVVPEGYHQTFPPAIVVDFHDDQIDPNGIGPDGEPIPPVADGRFHVVEINSGQSVSGIDFGNQKSKPGSIHGLKWHDLNGNGQREDDEPGLPGVTIYLDQNHNGQWDPDEPTEVTAEEDSTTAESEAGRYSFVDVTPGHYAVREVVPEGYHQTFPPTFIVPPVPFDPAGHADFEIFPFPLPDSAHHVRVESGQVVEGINFGNQKIEPGSVHGTKWLDSNGNGQRDDNERGLPGVVIYSDLNFNGQLDPNEPAVKSMEDNPDTDFDESGMYWLKGLRPGFHRITEVVPEGSVQTFPHDFDIALLEGLFERGHAIGPARWGGAHFVQIGSGQAVEGLDFGNRPVDKPSSLYGRKWVDLNGDGKADPDEPGLPGVTIYLDVNLNNQYDRGEPRTVTMRDDRETDRDEAGRYVLNTDYQGFAILREIVPDGYRQTFPEEFLCDAIFCVGQGHMVNVEPGNVIEGLNFGNQRMPQHDGVITGLKWLDQNGNGRRDDGEPGLPGVMIYADLNVNGRLDDHEPHVRTSRDDPDTERNEMGHYRLEGIPAGKVVIREVLPNGFDQTFPVAAASVHERAIVDLPPGVAFRFDVDSASWRPNADGELGLDLTFTVTWPNSCGTLLTDRATTEVDGGRIRAELFGTQVGEVCLQALTTQTQTVHVSDIATGEYQLRAVLNESGGPGEPFRESFFIEARIKLDRGAHEVELEPGQVLEGINFGNRRARGPIDEAISEMADFDANGQLGSLDIDMLAEMLRGNGPGVGHLRYDLTGDGKVNRADMDYLLNVILRTPYGDSNMDGRFGSGDFVHVFMRGKYENGIPGSAKWEDGDWNGDGVFTSADLIHAMLHSNYEAPAEAADALFARWN